MSGVAQRACPWNRSSSRASLLRLLGYRWRSRVRASLVVKCQSTCRWSALAASCQAASSVLRMSRSLDAAVQALAGQGGEFDLGDVEPGAVLGGVVDLQALGEGVGLGRFECLVERADGVGVEVVHHQHDLLGVGVVHGRAAGRPRGPSPHGFAAAGRSPGAGRPGARPTRRSSRFRAGRTRSPRGGRGRGRRGSGRGRGPGAGRASRPCTPPARRVVGAGVDVQDVLHPGDELAVGLGRDGPALLQMRAKCRFFNTRPMVEWSRSGMSSTSATCFSSSRSDQRACPAGGVEQANAINRASTSPVTIGSTGGVSRFLRLIVASTSPPRSA